MQTVRLELTAPIAVVELCSGLPGNEITEQTAYQLRDACERLSQDDQIWVIIVTGADGVFCTGTHLSAAEEHERRDILSITRALKIADAFGSLDKPVVAALNGDAIDQGLELALACDIRIASDRARFGLTQVKHGMMPWDGGTQRLPRLIGRSRAVEMVLTSRIVDAAEARDIGLVNEVAEPDKTVARAHEIASAIAGHGPIAARYLKEAVNKGLDMSLEQGLRLEADLNFILQSTADRAEGISSFLERRPPRYKGE